jgi:hypothetical protein
MGITMGDIRKATLAARVLTGDKALGTAVKAGRFQVQRVTFSKSGLSAVQPLSDYMTPDDTVRFLDELGADWGAAVLAVGAL